VSLHTVDLLTSERSVSFFDTCFNAAGLAY